MTPAALPHPVTGEFFPSPVPPGSGWPADPATTRTPVARSAADVARLAAAAFDVDALDARISVCRACPRLVDWREEVAVSARRRTFSGQPYWGRPGPGFGDPRPTVLVVGLAPAAHGANRTGRMFTGDRSGDWLYAALHRAGYAAVPSSVAAGDSQQLSGVRIVAAVRCAPPGNAPSAAERRCCAPWLARDLALSADSVRSILALGAVAWAAVLRGARDLSWAVPLPQPRFGHGNRADLSIPGGRRIQLVGSYHVSQQNTFTGRLTREMLDEVLATL